MAKASKEKKDVFIVVEKFMDKDDANKIYQPGDDVSDFDADRLKNLFEQGLVELSM